METSTTKYIQWALVSCLSLGISCSHLAPSDRGAQTSALEIRIKWVGAVTRPPIEVALATTTRLEEIKRWATGEPGYRSFATLSDDEARGVRNLLKTKDFAPSLHTEEPDFRFQQYVISVADDSTTEYFAIGLGMAAIYRLDELQGVLSKTSAAAIQPLIDELKETQKRNSGNH